MLARPTTFTDPVCGMHFKDTVDGEQFEYNHMTYYFCGPFCLQRFKKTPERFVGTPLIELRDIWKIFPMGITETPVLEDVHLRIWEGDFVVIIGQSGSGKSTLLNMLGLLDRPTHGSVILNGQNLENVSEAERALLRSQTFGFVFQQYNLIPWLTAYENVTLPRIFANTQKTTDGLEESFRDIGMFERMHHRPTQLSGGEQQRVALLRALANNPTIIIGDEPTGNLDSATGDKILTMLINLNKQENKTLIIVTHDIDIAERADQIITIKDGHIVIDHHIYKKMYTE